MLSLEELDVYVRNLRSVHKRVSGFIANNARANRPGCLARAQRLLARTECADRAWFAQWFAKDGSF